MAKKKKDLTLTDFLNQEEVTVTQPTQEAVLNSLALGIAKLQNGKWGLVEIAFNANTGESDVQDVTEFPSRDLASERFKVIAAKKIRI
jgi:hypothetical protein